MQGLVGGSRPLRWIVIAAAFWLCWAGEAGAQCSISGPASMCGSAQLCGPSGQYQYQWTGPDGFTSQLKCVIVTLPGTYSLRVFDTLNGLWFGPCTHDVAAGQAPSCSVAGADTVCPGATAELCGPAGASDYLWSGPNGFSATSPCVSVGEPGTYGLSVREMPDGCWSTACEHTLVQGMCDVEPPPPPRESCPRSACWWGAQCEDDDDDDGSGRFGPDGLATIAGCADAQAAAFSWSDSRHGLCSTLHDRSGLRQRAHRQFAAALANVCAFTTQVTQKGNPVVGLDPDAEIHLEGFEPTTVAAWLAQTDHSLIELRGQSNGRDARRTYRRIITVGWAINHGHGVGPVCSRKGTHLSSDESDIDSETIDQELAIEDGLPTLELESASPNPFTLSSRIVYFVGGSGPAPVEIGIYDLAGRRVRALVAQPLGAGRHETTWDGRDDSGRAVLNGVYFVRGHSGADAMQSRLTLLR